MLNKKSLFILFLLMLGGLYFYSTDNTAFTYIQKTTISVKINKNIYLVIEGTLKHDTVLNTTKNEQIYDKIKKLKAGSKSLIVTVSRFS